MATESVVEEMICCRIRGKDGLSPSESLFASGLQQSDAPTGATVAEAVQRTVRQFGVRGCTGRMAQEFGDHPEAAMDRMRWVRQLVGGRPAYSTQRAA